MDKKNQQNKFIRNNRNNLQNGKNNDNKGNSKFNLTWVYIGLLALLFVMIFSNNGEKTSKLPYTKFQECMDSGYVDNIFVNKADQELTFEIKKDYRLRVGESLPLDSKGRLVLVTNFSSVDKLDEFIQQTKKNGRFNGDVKYENGGSGFWDVFWQIFPFIFLIAFWIIIMRRMGGGSGGGIFSFGKSKAKLFDGGKSGSDKITFKDVAGLYGAKQEVQEVVDFLRNPQKYTELGGKIPKGILLVGPPGTGKTLLAKAVAGEANVSFFSLSGSDFVEMFVGVGASRVRDLFQQAKQKAPCIVFIDEIDAIGRARSGKASIQSNDERESTLNQLLTEMDGFGANTGVIVMAATNRADILDKALLRAGRFDRQITVELPDLKERQQIFNVHLKPIKIDESVDVETLARQTPGLSGADIANVCNEAALIAARRKQEWVDKQCFLDAVDRVLGGLEKKTKVMTESEKRTIAIHEAGHATISWFLQHANPLVKVTIVPRGNALGANWYMPEERPVTTKEELLDQICGLLGGRAAEELFTGHICTGASNDLERVTKMVYGMISVYGMGQRMPNVNYYNFSENSFSRPYSEATAQMIDEEVKDLIQLQYERAKEVLSQHAQGLQQLAQLLIDKEVIYPADLEMIFGPRQWRSRSDEIMELNENIDKGQQSDNDQMVDFADENAEIIRQKALAAVVEKQRRLMEEQEKQKQMELEEQRRKEEYERKERLRREEMRRHEETRRLAEQRRMEDRKRREEERARMEKEQEDEEEQRRLKAEQDYMNSLGMGNDADDDNEEDVKEVTDNQTLDNENYEPEKEALSDVEDDIVKDEDDVVEVEDDIVEEEDSKTNEDVSGKKANIELSLFPDEIENDDRQNPPYKDEENENELPDTDFQNDEPTMNDDYNPFLDSWSAMDSSSETTEDDNDKEMAEDNQPKPSYNVPDKTSDHEMKDKDENVVESEDNAPAYDKAVEDDEPQELAIDLSDDESDDDVVEVIEDELPEQKQPEKEIVNETEETDDIIADEKVAEIQDETVDPIRSNALEDEEKTDEEKTAEEDNDDDEEEGEEVALTSSRRRRKLNIEEVLPDNEQDDEDDEDEIVIDLNDE